MVADGTGGRTWRASQSRRPGNVRRTKPSSIILTIRRSRRYRVKTFSGLMKVSEKVVCRLKTSRSPRFLACPVFSTGPCPPDRERLALIKTSISQYPSGWRNFFPRRPYYYYYYFSFLSARRDWKFMFRTGVPRCVSCANNGRAFKSPLPPHPTRHHR